MKTALCALLLLPGDSRGGGGFWETLGDSNCLP